MYHPRAATCFLALETLKAGSDQSQNKSNVDWCAHLLVRHVPELCGILKWLWVSFIYVRESRGLSPNATEFEKE